MPHHPRPHLSTLNRKHHQSAVAAAAYRLGANLRDDRKEHWHDYRKRDAATEVVFAATYAPTGFPAQASDAQWLWNAAEAAERRRDSQLARDYRVPIPYGLSEAEAAELATDLAHFIADELATSVSVGVHRDSELDAMGATKAEHQRGYHAHLMFPTRMLVRPREIGDALVFGAKLSILSNARTSAAVVERFNAKWAEFANRQCAACGIERRYEHRSLARLGVAQPKMPVLTHTEVALERQGFFTGGGNRLRDIRFAPDGPEAAAVSGVKSAALEGRRQRRERTMAAVDQRLAAHRDDVKDALLAKLDAEWEMDLAHGELAAAEATLHGVSIGSAGGIEAGHTLLAQVAIAQDARARAQARLTALEASADDAQACLETLGERVGQTLERRRAAQARLWAASADVRGGRGTP